MDVRAKRGEITTVAAAGERTLGVELTRPLTDSSLRWLESHLHLSR